MVKDIAVTTTVNYMFQFKFISLCFSTYCVTDLRSNVLNGSSRVGIAFNGKMLRAFLSRHTLELDDSIIIYLTI